MIDRNIIDILSPLSAHIIRILRQKATDSFDSLTLAIKLVFGCNILAILPTYICYRLHTKIINLSLIEINFDSSFNYFTENPILEQKCLFTDPITRSLLRTDFCSDIYTNQIQTGVITTIKYNKTNECDSFLTGLWRCIDTINDIEFEITVKNTINIDLLLTIFNAIKEVRILGIRYTGAALYTEYICTKKAQISERTLKLSVPYSVNTGVIYGQFRDLAFSSRFDENIIEDITANIYHEDELAKLNEDFIDDIDKSFEYYIEYPNTYISDLQDYRKYNGYGTYFKRGPPSSQIIFFVSKRDTLEPLPLTNINISLFEGIIEKPVSVEKLENNMYRISGKAANSDLSIILQGISINHDTCTLYAIHSIFNRLIISGLYRVMRFSF